MSAVKQSPLKATPPRKNHDGKLSGESKSGAPAETSGKIDPLYVIFEQHLYNFQDAEIDRKTFAENVLKDYFSFLRRKKIIIPKSLESSIQEELANQVLIMLTKKIYGFLTIQDYQKNQGTEVRKRAKSRYKRLSG